ncbi:hypothetical protein OCV58_12030 [Megasphaera butyrica]|uniref:hypothetical protein n=1 Tax=Megasphaera butyrica TaxID=2981791 RepID=UPI0008208F77|nr:hypothetical protein [Megasphaera butyrica]MCU6715626.1 hypothetical protein [Megasphaera butyrica]SCJ70186.1 Uncharacterised protein [uncultured Ruminococcus sp.]
MRLELIQEILKNQQSKEEDEVFATTNFMLNDLREKGICSEPSYPEKDFDGIFQQKSNLVIG